MSLAVNFDAFDALTFDCYGTLIDWEAGLLAGLRAVLDPRGIQATDDALLETYAGFEEDAEAGPYLRYRDVLAVGLRGVCDGFGCWGSVCWFSCASCSFSSASSELSSAVCEND